MQLLPSILESSEYHSESLIYSYVATLLFFSYRSVCAHFRLVEKLMITLKVATRDMYNYSICVIFCIHYATPYSCMHGIIIFYCLISGSPLQVFDNVIQNLDFIPRFQSDPLVQLD